MANYLVDNQDRPTEAGFIAILSSLDAGYVRNRERAMPMGDIARLPWQEDDTGTLFVGLGALGERQLISLYAGVRNETGAPHEAFALQRRKVNGVEQDMLCVKDLEGGDAATRLRARVDETRAEILKSRVTGVRPANFFERLAFDGGQMLARASRFVRRVKPTGYDV